MNDSSEEREQSPRLLFPLLINLVGSLQAEIRACRDHRTVSGGAEAPVESGSIPLICSTCSCKFSFSRREQEHHTKNNFGPPRRCAACRLFRNALFAATGALQSTAKTAALSEGSLSVHAAGCFSNGIKSSVSSSRPPLSLAEAHINVRRLKLKLHSAKCRRPSSHAVEVLRERLEDAKAQRDALRALIVPIPAGLSDRGAHRRGSPRERAAGGGDDRAVRSSGGGGSLETSGGVRKRVRRLRVSCGSK